MRARTGVRKIRQILEKYLRDIGEIVDKDWRNILQTLIQNTIDYYIQIHQINSDYKKVCEPTKLDLWPSSLLTINLEN